MRFMDYKQFLESKRKRDDTVRTLRAKGWKVEQLADRFKITKQRVSQICKVNGKAA